MMITLENVILRMIFFYSFFFFFLGKLVGSPDDSSLGFLRSNNARRYVRQLPQFPKQQFSMKFPNKSPLAVDLLEKMLVFDPSKRITGLQVSNVLFHPLATLSSKSSFFSANHGSLLLSAVDEALCHPYLSSLHDINDEPVCARPFSFDFEQPSLTEEDIKELIWRESVKFNPDPAH